MIKETITEQLCPLCGECLTIVENHNEKTMLCGLSESCGYVLPLAQTVNISVNTMENC